MQTLEEMCYRDLANAIVLQAVEDYRNALNGRSYNRYSPDRVIIELENFFHSEYYQTLTKVNGDYLIELLKEEHIENERIKNESYTDTSNTKPNRKNSKDSLHLLR